MCLQYVPHGGICDVVIQVLECSLNSIESPRGILSGKSNNRIDDHLSDSWPTVLSFIAGIELLCDEIPIPTENRVRCNDGCQLAQSFATDSVSLNVKYPTLIIVEQQSLFSELLEQGLDLCVLELNDLLLLLIDHGAEGSEQNVSGLEKEGHARRQNRQFPVPRGEIKRRR